MRLSKDHGGLPTGGSTGNVLTKTSSGNFAHDWISSTHGLKTGQIMLASSIDETNYLKCNGAFHLRSSYPALAAVIGAPIMMSSETTTFFNNSIVVSPFVHQADGVLFTTGTVSSTSTSVLSGTLLSSPDGTTWTARSAFNPKHLTEGRIAAVSNGTMTLIICEIGGLMSSVDLSTWTRITTGLPSLSIRELAFGGTASRIFAVGQSTGPVAHLCYADNGSTYNVVNNHGFIDTSIVSIAANAGLVIAVGGQGGLRYSADGTTTWDPVVISGLYGSPRRISYANSLFILTTSTGNVYTSTNGTVWTAKGITVPSSKVFWNGTVYVATNGTISRFSNDLMSWHLTSSIVSTVMSDKFWGRKTNGTVFTVDTEAYNSTTHFPVPAFTTSGGAVTGAYQVVQAWIKT